MMFAGIVKWIIAAVSIIVFATGFSDEWGKLRRQEREYDAFERGRAERQEEFDRHARAVARALLMQEYARVHFVGEAWDDGKTN